MKCSNVCTLTRKKTVNVNCNQILAMNNTQQETIGIEEHQTCLFRTTICTQYIVLSNCRMKLAEILKLHCVKSLFVEMNMVQTVLLLT